MSPFDTFHDKRNGFLFYVTPVGGMWDSLTTDERTNNGDWNTVWDAKGRRTANGWIAEIAIPFKSLRYKPGRDQVWGINLRRGIRHKNENAYISPIKPQWGVGGIFHMSAAATLVGLEAPPTGKNLELKPATVNRLTTDRLAVPTISNQLKSDLSLDVMFVSAIVQYASSTSTTSTNFRFRWEYQPGSELFVVYTDGHDTEALLRKQSLQNRGVVVKANRLFRF